MSWQTHRAIGGRDRTTQRVARIKKALEKAAGDKRAELEAELERLYAEAHIPPAV